MPPAPSDRASSSQSCAENAGYRIAGSASRAVTSSGASAAPLSAMQHGMDARRPIKLDRDRHTAHRLASNPTRTAAQPQARIAERQSRQLSHRTNPVQSSRASVAAAQALGSDDDDEEGAIEDSGSSGLAQSSPSVSTFRPPPPKTPPTASTVVESRSNARGSSVGSHRIHRDRHAHSHRDQYRSYQPRSPSPSRVQPTSSQALPSHMQSPSPPTARRNSTDVDNSAFPPAEQRNHRQQLSSRGDHSMHRAAGNGEESRIHKRTKDDRYVDASATEWDRGKQVVVDAARGRDLDWRVDRRWDGERRGESAWDRDRVSVRRSDRVDRDRPWDHVRNNPHRTEQRDRLLETNARARELSPVNAGREHRFVGWSPTPPHPNAENHALEVKHNVDEDAFASRPPSRMGRSEPAPLLSRQHSTASVVNRSADLQSTRTRSPGVQRSPPAGLLKRKPNFNAVVPPTIPPIEKDVTAVTHNHSVAPGAPIPPSINTLESPVLPSHLGSDSALGAPLPGSHPASTLPTVSATASANAVSLGITAADANFTTTCDALDDLSCASVRLSCLPRKSQHGPAISGRQRRQSRPPPVPLNKRKFVGCSSLDDYEISIKLGQGTFGEVLKGRHILTGTQVALKKVTIHDAKDGLPITALREIKLLKKLKHPSIVPVIDMAYRPSGERGKLGDVYMVEPYMDHDLNGMLENPSIRLEHSQIKLYMKQLLEGTLYLHKNRILHRDMKAANLLINNKGQLQIADFGLARPYRDPGQTWTGKGWTGGTHRYTNMVVTRWYRPPELLAGEKKYGPPIDMWGIGCILAEMVMGKPLFKGTSEINQLELIAKLCGSPNETSFPGWSSLPGVKDADPTGRPDPHPEIPGQHEFGNYPRRVKDQFRNLYDAGPGCADLIDKLLVLDPKKRLTAQQALEHEWFWTKPYPADPASLPKYEHSKEIDRAKREWKPAPAVVSASASASAGVGTGVASMASGPDMGGGVGIMNAGVRPPMQYLPPQQQQVRPYGRGPYPPPSNMQNGRPPGLGMRMGMGGQPNSADGWDGPPAGGRMGFPQHQRPPTGPAGARPYPHNNNPGGSGRHPFPIPPPQPAPQSRFPHPNQRPPPQHHPFHNPNYRPQQPNLPSRPNLSRNSSQNPYSM